MDKSGLYGRFAPTVYLLVTFAARPQPHHNYPTYSPNRNHAWQERPATKVAGLKAILCLQSSMAIALWKDCIHLNISMGSVYSPTEDGSLTDLPQWTEQSASLPLTMMNLQQAAHAFRTHGRGSWHAPNVTVPIEDWHLEWVLLPLEPEHEEWIAIHIPTWFTVRGKWHAETPNRGADPSHVSMSTLLLSTNWQTCFSISIFTDVIFLFFCLFVFLLF